MAKNVQIGGHLGFHIFCNRKSCDHHGFSRSLDILVCEKNGGRYKEGGGVRYSTLSPWTITS